MVAVIAAAFAGENYSKSFGTQFVIKQASLHAYAGRILGIVGVNGSGKTTLLRCALGLTRADSGSTFFLGNYQPKPRLNNLARRGLWFVDQNARLPIRWTVADLFRATGSRYRSFSLSQLDYVDCVHLAGRRVGELSNYERRAVALCLAIGRSPICLITDEPLQGLSPVQSARISSSLLALRAQGCAVVVTGHNVESLFAIADEVLWMSSGSTVLLGPPNVALQNHDFRREYYP